MTKPKKAERKYGVRIYKVAEDALLIKQTIKRGSGLTDDYVMDGQKERHVDIDDDSAIADAVRDGVNGRLKAGKG